MERFYIIAPAVLPLAFMLVMLAYFSVRCAMGKQPDIKGVDRRKYTEIIGPFLTAYLLWLIRPIERFFVASRVSPNFITAISVLLCATAGVAAGTGYLPVALWAFVAAGMLDILDGRLARATNRSSRAGAFLDSVSDRWGELFVFAGFAWYLRETPWLLLVMLAVGSSMMVSYTRARGEGLGIELDGGTMQRAERILLLSVGMCVAAWYDASESGSQYTHDILGSAIAITGALTALTSIGRWTTGYRMLRQRERDTMPEREPANVVLASEIARPATGKQPVTAGGEHAASTGNKHAA